METARENIFADMENHMLREDGSVLVNGRIFKQNNDHSFTMIPTGMDEARVKSAGNEVLEPIIIEGELYTLKDGGRRIEEATDLEKLLAKTMAIYKDVVISEQVMEQAARAFLEDHPQLAESEITLQQEVVLMQGDEPIATMGSDHQFHDMEDIERQLDELDREEPDHEEPDRDDPGIGE